MAAKATIGFIGIGVIGKSMAGHLLTAGHPLNVFNRTRSKADALVEAGAVWRSSVGDLAAHSDVIVTIVGFPDDVEQVYLGDDGIIGKAKAGALLIDMTTSSPDLAKRIYDTASARGISALDAPVSGGDVGAREARLSIMVGGSKAAFKRATPLFEILGKNVVYQGAAGSGQHTKLCNQIVIASSMVAICEAMIYAKRSGLDPFTVLKSIESGAAGSWSLSNLAPRFLKEDFAPGFFVKHFLKDMRIAIESAERMNLHLPGLVLAKQLYDRLARAGSENDGTQALFTLYEQGFDAESGSASSTSG